MNQKPDKYGCHNRPPIRTFGQQECQFTRTWLGQTDKRCEGCKHKEVKNGESQQQPNRSFD